MAKQIIDGCTAATHIAYALSDVATIYPITPIASMGETAQKWGMQGRKNYMGMPMRVAEMESELGAAGATHGALAAGSLATTFTNSQGLMLMLPNMYKMAGNLVPAVFHVGARTLATHALSIFGDHSDVMATRASGFTYLSSASVQETMDLALVAHLAAIEGGLPVCHFFDGWRISNQMDTIELIDYNTIFSLVNWQKIHEFRSNALNPEHPSLRGSAQNADVFFQNAEAANSRYAAFPAIIQEMMNKVATVTNRQYHLFDYFGAADPEIVIIAMGSSCEVIELTINELNKQGYKTGLVKVRLYRPWSGDDLLRAIPESAKVVVTLDRTKEAGAEGEPLFKDVATAAMTGGRNFRMMGGRYGLASKEFNPAMVKAICDEASKPSPKRFFTVGITDDVTHLSLPVDYTFCLPSPGTAQAIFYGIGSDGTVGATKQAARIIGNSDNLYAQAYFQYSAKKSGGYTISELRFSANPIKADYGIENADYVGCNKATYVSRFSLLNKLKPGGIFVLNCPWSNVELADRLPAAMRKELADKKIRFYTINAQAIAESAGLGNRVNMIMETVFFHLIGVIPFDTAMQKLRQEITSSYMHEGADIVNKNLHAVDMAVQALRPIAIPQQWSTTPQTSENSASSAINGQKGLPSTTDFFNNISRRCLHLEGNSLPVSVFTPDGRMPMGTTAFEKRRIAVSIPRWNPDKCVECTECSLVCAHAAIRPYLLDSNEMAKAPSSLLTRPGEGAEPLKHMRYRIQVYPEDCTGCSSCAVICPGHALSMTPIAEELPLQLPLLEFVEKNVSVKNDLIPRFTVNGSQFNQPLLQFSGACAGCGETPYVKLLTQLFGERMIIANATGCSSVWGANYPSNAYCVRNTDRRGPAWGNSLFEDNAEYGYGMAVSCRQRRNELANAMQNAIKSGKTPKPLCEAMELWLSASEIPEASEVAGKKIIELINATPQSQITDEMTLILHNADMLGKKSIWAIGGDGWAYDIGFAGLDHVLASGEDINILVLDTECYSNTGGQTSKATPLGAVTKYSTNGKRTFKKDLGRMMMTYGTVYVASVALGANYQQTIDALREAEAYPGPSIVIAYCPCINHGIRAGMGNSIVEERKAVEAGYWPIYRYNPLLAAHNLSPYISDTVAAENKRSVNGLPATGSPTIAESSDQTAAGEGAWMNVNDETTPLTVDYPAQAHTSANLPQQPTPQKNNQANNTNSYEATLFPPQRLFEFLDGEDRYADIRLVAPQSADRLRATLSARTQLLHQILSGLTHVI